MIASPDTLVDRARQRTGLDDLGPDGWQEGLERLVTAAAADLAGDEDARAWLEATIDERLTTRLQVEQWYREQAEAPPPVDDLLVITGLPRTGTTALHYLLALDPTFRHLRGWELKPVVPPPELATEADDPRRPSERSGSAQHIATVDGPVEDGRIHALAFRNGELVLPLPSYSAWWRSADHRSAFTYHERILRLLHSSRPPTTWLLKSPQYVYQLADMSGQYPQARFVVTHRDLAAVVPSTCSVVLASRQTRLPGRTPDPVAFGRSLLDHWAEGVERMIAARAVLGEDRFLDVSQAELESDPSGTAERVFAFAGRPLTDEVRAAIERWSAGNRRGARGEHRYRADEFGLTEADINVAFAPYLERYGDLCGSTA